VDTIQMTTFSYQDLNEDLPVPVTLTSQKLPEEAIVTDDEFLLRKEFESNPEKGFELLFRRYYVNLCNHAIRFVHSKEAAEDIHGFLAKPDLPGCYRFLPRLSL
jgi:hypothetical protein